MRVANPIYREVFARLLAGGAESKVLAEPRSFVLPDGRLDFDRLLREFADFWREHGEVLAAGVSYRVGRGRMDLLVRWPYSDGGQRRLQRHALELKVWRDGEGDPLAKGLEQLDAYLQRLGLDEGVLVVFDRRSQAGSAESRTRFEQAQTPSGRKVIVLRS